MVVVPDAWGVAGSSRLADEADMNLEVPHIFLMHMIILVPHLLFAACGVLGRRPEGKMVEDLACVRRGCGTSADHFRSPSIKHHTACGRSC